MVQDVREEHHIEGIIGEGYVDSVECRDRNASSRPNQNVNSLNGQVRTPGMQHGGDQTISAANVQDPAVGRDKAGEPIGEDFRSSSENQLVVQQTCGGVNRICWHSMGATKL